METKKCEICGKEFVPAKDATCCSNKCHQKRWRITNGISIIRESRKCIICGTEFQPKREGHICCSKNCSRKRNKMVQKEQKRMAYADEREYKKAREAMPESNHDKIADIAIEARKHGMTYGQYVAKMGV